MEPGKGESHEGGGWLDEESDAVREQKSYAYPEVLDERRQQYFPAF